MRTASTLPRTEEIILSLNSPRCTAVAEVAVKNGAAWETLEDLDEEQGIDWESAGMRFDYSSLPLVPPASQINFKLRNFAGKYSPGSGTAWANLIDADTKVRLRAGYLLSDFGVLATDSATAYFAYYFTMAGASDQLNSVGNTNYFFKDFDPGLYGDPSTYGDATYGAYGYLIFRRLISNQVSADKTTSVTVTATTDGFAVYGMAVNDENQSGYQSSQWSYLGRTVEGSVTLSCDLVGRYLYVAVVRIGGTWADSVTPSVSFTYQSKTEWIYYSCFYLDSPEFNDPPAPEIPTVACSGRDIFKRAQETLFNFQDLSGGVAIDAAMKMVLDACGIPYTADSIDNLGAFADRTLAGGLGAAETADKVLEKLIQCTWQDGLPRYLAYIKYDAATDDNVFFFKERPSVFAETNVFSYSNMENIGARRKNYDKIIKRITVLSKKETLDKETLLGSDSYTQADAGSNTISWTGNAENKRIVKVVTSGSPTVTITDVSPTSITFTIGGTAPYAFTFEIYGSKWKSTVPDSEGEWIHLSNMISGKGKTLVMENGLVLDAAEAKSMAKAFDADFGDPSYEIGALVSPYLNLLYDVLSTSLVWSKINFIDTLFYITNCKHQWTRGAAPIQKTTYTLTDTGKTLSDLGRITWDSGFKWDAGWLWDMMGGPRQAEDTTDYNYLRPLEFT